MNHTTNLSLPQWEESDRIMHGDFNDAFAKLDASALIVPLRTITLTEDTTQVNIDLSDHDWAKFPRILLCARGDCSATYANLYANNGTGTVYKRYKDGNSYDSNSFGSVYLGYTNRDEYTPRQSALLLMSTPLQKPRCRPFHFGAGTPDASTDVYYLNQDAVLTGVQIGNGSSQTIYAGSSFTLYGICL